ncbi:MAG: YlzJ-like family protein [Oscillospiraceae bacterium]
MILQTIIDTDVVLNQINFCEHKYINVNNCIIDAVKMEDSYVISRLISTNPKDYLNNSYQLGTKIQANRV